MYNLIIGALIGSAVGTLSGWQGVSGSVFIQLALLLTGVAKTQANAAGTTLLAMMFPISGLAVWDYYKRGKVDIGLGLVITLFYTILAAFGAKLNEMTSPKVTFIATGLTQSIAAMIFLYKGFTHK